jgi:fibronectin-binding autotransporter adhesin
MGQVTLVNGVSGSAIITQAPTSSSSNTAATTQFTSNAIAFNRTTIPFTGITGGLYNQNTLGSGLSFAILVTSGSITGIATIVSGGTNYVVGDILTVNSGNYDAVVRVIAVSSGAITTLGVLYGGTGYTTGLQTVGSMIPPGNRFITLAGTLTSNVTITIATGPILYYTRSVIYANNTTGSFTVTVILSNGAGGTTGTGITLTQGTNNSTAQLTITDGTNDIWKVA